MIRRHRRQTPTSQVARGREGSVLFMDSKTRVRLAKKNEKREEKLGDEWLDTKGQRRQIDRGLILFDAKILQVQLHPRRCVVEMRRFIIIILYHSIYS